WPVLVFLPPPPCQNTGPATQLFSAAGPYLFLCPALYSLPTFTSLVASRACTVLSLLVIPCTMSAVSGHLLDCLQSLVIPWNVSAVSGHLYCVHSLWSSPVLCPQSLVIPCTMSAVSCHLLYCVCSLWSFPVLCLQSIGSEYIFFFFFS
ncbi:unnamed protein product, partial [Staurois parvus]